MVRELAGHDPDQARRIAHWPVREALLAYVAKMKSAALEDYRWATLTFWASVPSAKKPGKPPRRPPILKG